MGFDYRIGRTKGNSKNTGRKREGLQQAQRSSEASLEKFLDNYLVEKPNMLSKMNLRFFDSSVNIIAEDWDLFEVEEEKIELVQSRLLNALEKVKDHDLKEFQIVEDSADNVKLTLPPLDPKRADLLSNEVTLSFSAIFSDRLAKEAANNFIKNNLTSTGAIDNRARIVTIVPVSENLAKLGKKYEILTNVLYPNTDVSKALEDGSGSFLNSTELVSELLSKLRTT